MRLYDKLHMIHRCWSYRFKSEMPSIRYLLKCNLGGTTLIDIGANKGVYSIYMSRAAGKDGKVIAFEAQPELGAHLQLVKENFDLDNLNIVNQGLSSSPGVMKMGRVKAGAGGASFYYDPAEGLEEISVPVTTLDEFLGDKDNGLISFIKCDVEGHEYDVFKGAIRTLKKHLPILLFECHQPEADKGEIFQYLSDLGYDGYFFYVSPADHANYLRKGRGKYVHYSEHANYEYVRPTVRHRNYIFVPQGTAPV